MKSKRFSESGQLVYICRLSWALCHLKQSGLISSINRGIYKIEDLGLKFLSNNPTKITCDDLMQFPKFLKFRNKCKNIKCKKVNNFCNKKIFHWLKNKEYDIDVQVRLKNIRVKK